MRVNEHQVKAMALNVLNKAAEDVVKAIDAMEAFAEVFGLCDDQTADREKELELLTEKVCELEPAVPKCTVAQVIRTAFAVLEDAEDEEDMEDEEDE